MGWEYCLVESCFWQEVKGGSLEELVTYGAAKNISLFVWYDYEVDIRRITDDATRRQELRSVAALGVRGVVVNLPISDTQAMLQFHRDFLSDAYEMKLMVVFYGCAPRGYERAWPHLLGTGAPRSLGPFKTQDDFNEAEPREHAFLPYTTGPLGGFVYFSANSGGHASHPETHAHILALHVLFSSRFLCYTETAEFYRALPEVAREILRAVPAEWDETRYVAGLPGTTAFVARRSGVRWFVAGISAQASGVNFVVQCDFLARGTAFAVRAIQDPSNEEGVGTTSFALGSLVREMTITLLPHGGYLAMIEPSGVALLSLSPWLLVGFAVVPTGYGLLWLRRRLTIRSRAGRFGGERGE